MFPGTSQAEGGVRGLELDILMDPKSSGFNSLDPVSTDRVYGIRVAETQSCPLG